MQLNRCPICHARIGVDALVQDESGRELLGLLCKLNTEAGSALVAYLGLFRSTTRDLANDKALRLAKSALALAPWEMVTAAMQQTVESLQGKGGRALTNHNYLKKVLEALLLSPFTAAPKENQIMPYGLVKRSKTAQSLAALEEFGNE